MRFRDLAEPFRVWLDDLSIARLMEMADDCHATPEQVIASIVHDVLEDDANAHTPEIVPLH